MAPPAASALFRESTAAAAALDRNCSIEMVKVVMKEEKKKLQPKKPLYTFRELIHLRLEEPTPFKSAYQQRCDERDVPRKRPKERQR